MKPRYALILLILALSTVLPGGGCFSAPLEAKKPFTVLWVDSYHHGYEWSDGIEQGLRNVLDGTAVQLEIFHMDTKRNPSEEYMLKAGKQALERIRQLEPEVVIASDDNAQKYLVVPFLKDTPLPVVFCGVNWDASGYGYPAENITGMLEVENVPAMIKLFKMDAKGDRVGYLSGMTVSDKKIADSFNDQFFDGVMKTYFVHDFAAWKGAFLHAQDEVDMLFVRNYAGIKGWDHQEAERFLVRHTRIPTGSHLDFMKHHVVYTLGKVAEEQGEFAALATLKIQQGTRPADIPIAQNSRVQLTVNFKMASSAGIVIPVSILKTAEIIGVE